MCSSDLFPSHDKGIKGTPFQLIEYEGKFHIAWTEYALTMRMNTEEEALELLETDVWNIMGVYAISIMEQRRKLKEIMGTDSLIEIVEKVQKQQEQQAEQTQ